MTAVEEIKARVDVVELIGETVRLRRSGKNYTGFCPFHANVHTPSFAVFPDSGTWRCFGACNEGGDIFRFVMKKEGVDFPEALRRLAARAGVELHPRTPEETRAEEEHARLRTLLETASTFYRSTLLNPESGGKVLEYLHGRGFSDSILEAFQIGMAPDGWDAGGAFLRGKGYTDPELLEAGLVIQRDAGGFYDRFRNRIMIPIRDSAGRLCGFGARIINPADQPKFINSAQSPLFDKGHLLFGLDRAGRSIRAAGEAVIVEGYLDVLGAHQAGFENVVSPMGTALTEPQLRLLKRYAKQIVLALDPDSAGDAATLRGLDLAREALDRQGEAVFDARGLIRYESRLQADLRVASLPPGKDPDEVVLADPEDWRRRIADAQPVVLHVLGVLTRGQNLNDPKVKSIIAARMLPLIEDVANSVERDAYRQQVARTLRIDERSLSGSVPARGRRRPAKPEPRAESAPAGPSARTVREAYNIGLLMRQPGLLFRLDRTFSEMGLERIGSEDFTEPLYGELMNRIREAALQEEETRDFLGSDPEPALVGAMEEATRVFVKRHWDSDPTAEEALEGMLHLRQQTLERQLSDIRYFLDELSSEAGAQTDAEIQAARSGAFDRMKGFTESKLKINRALQDRFPAGPARNA